MAVVTTAKWRRRHLTLVLAFLGIFLAILSQNWASAEVFSSASEMKEVFRLERELVSIMDGFASKLQTKLNKINSYLEVTLDSDQLYSEGFYFGQYEHIWAINRGGEWIEASFQIGTKIGDNHGQLNIRLNQVECTKTVFIPRNFNKWPMKKLLLDSSQILLKKSKKKKSAKLDLNWKWNLWIFAKAPKILICTA